MLAADVPLWFAAVGLFVPAVTALLTLLIANRRAERSEERAVNERAKDRTHEVQVEAWRALRSDRIDLYRKLVAAARSLLAVNQPREPELRAYEAALQAGQPPEHQRGKLHETWERVQAKDAWDVVLTETKLIGGPRVVEAAAAVGRRDTEVYGAAIRVQLAKWKGEYIEPDEDEAMFDEIREQAKSSAVIDQLIEACATDVKSLTESVQ